MQGFQIRIDQRQVHFQRDILFGYLGIFEILGQTDHGSPEA